MRYAKIVYVSEKEEWYPVVNDEPFESMGGFIDPISAGIITMEVEDEIRKDKENILQKERRTKED